MEKEQLYCIGWKSKLTGSAGHGTKKFTHDEAREICDNADKENPELEHYPFPVREGSL